MKTQRGKISDYMKYLRVRQGYTSLKMEYLQMQFPALGGHPDTDNGFGHMVETEESVAQSTEIAGDDAVAMKQLSDINALQQQLLESDAKARADRSAAMTALKKLKHVEKVASQRIVEQLPGLNFDEDSDHLAMLLATVLENDDFEYNIESDKVEPKSSSDFLKRIEDNLGDVPDKESKMTFVRNKVLDKMKRTLRRERHLSTSGSVCSLSSRSSSKTRQRSEGDELEEENAAKVSRPSSLKSAGHHSKLPGPLKLH